MHEPHEFVTIKCVINQQKVQSLVSVRQHLVDFLRESQRLTGAHLGCEHGICGACTVKINGDLVRGCLVLAVQADGCEIETIEGAVKSGRLDGIMEAFQACNAAQCGFCTPAMLMTVAELLDQQPRPSRSEIREQISGNYCRCTGYQAIVDAVEMCFDKGTVNE
jgi:aerobic carbon-monoxide dehydrogenase small subunit